MPPPPGRCTSSSTTSGTCCSIAATASSTSAASATTSTAPPELGLHTGAEHRVVVDEHDTQRRGRLRSRTSRSWLAGRTSSRTCSASLLGERGVTGINRRTSVPLSGCCSRPPRATVAARSGRRSSVVRRAGPRGTSSRSKPRPTVADEDLELALGRLGVHVDLRRAGVLGSVDHRLPGGRHDGRGGRVDRAVADRHQLDRHVVRDLDLADRVLERCLDGRRPGRRALEQPGTQLALLGAGELSSRSPGRRPGAGSGPASAAPSRAGAPRRRHAPGCGCARSARGAGLG